MYKSMKFSRENFFFCKYARNGLLGGEIIKWKNEKNRKNFFAKNLQVHENLQGENFFLQICYKWSVRWGNHKIKKRKNRKNSGHFENSPKKILAKDRCSGSAKPPAHLISMMSINMKSLRSPIFPVSVLPITPCEIFGNFGNSPKIQMTSWRHQIFIQDRGWQDLQNCGMRTFYLEWFGHGWRPKFEIWRGIPGNSDVEFHSNSRERYLR